MSPAFAGFDELLRGLPHVRAFAMESRYQDRFYQRVDKFQSFDHVYVRLLHFEPCIEPCMTEINCIVARLELVDVEI